MEDSEDPETKLLLQPWASVCLAESNTLMTKAWFGDAGYALLLSDLNNMWYERADIDMIQQRSKELNKRLTAQASSLLNCLRNLICPLLEGQKNNSTSFSCQPNSDTLILHVKSELSGLPFYWDFHCSAAPVEMISRHLVRPLMSMSLMLQCQVQELTALLFQKDAEIEDYLENGATLSRERLKTETFKEESFLQTFYSQTLLHACSLGDGHLFTSSLKELYIAVTQEQARPTRKRHREASGDSVTCEHPSSQHLPQKVMDLTKRGDKTESQLTSTESVQDTLAIPSQTEKAQLLLAKTKKKKAKGLFG